MSGFIHGHAPNDGRSSTYNSWRAMKRRCVDPKHSHCKRGVTYDPRWSRFEAFFADMGARPTGCTLARVDHDKPYSMDNCEWGDADDNRRANRGNPRPWNTRPHARPKHRGRDAALSGGVSGMAAHKTAKRPRAAAVGLDARGKVRIYADIAPTASIELAVMAARRSISKKALLELLINDAAARGTI